MIQFLKSAKLAGLFLLMFSVGVMIVSCVSSNTGDKNKDQDNNAEHEHSYVCDEENSIKARALSDGKKVYKCTECEHSYTETVPATKSFKVLAIGNSFSEDATAHLYDICKSAGIEEIVIGNLFIGGCSLDTHLTNIKANISGYDFQLNTSGKWEHNYKSTVSQALEYTDWDFITLQQVSGYTGIYSSYGSMHAILEHLEANKPKDTTEIYWHMTWAYQQNSTHADFSKYGKSQMKMYQMIVDTTKKKVLADQLIDGVIPSGTAIQNLRTSPLGDVITRDGYHLSIGAGRYTAALTWFSTLTGGDLDDVEYVASIDNKIKGYIFKAVGDAVKAPYQVTEFES